MLDKIKTGLIYENCSNLEKYLLCIIGEKIFDIHEDPLSN